MSTLRGWFEPLGEMPKEFTENAVKGTSMTVPGQGSDLALIIQSIVKLPPLDERTFDSPAGEDPDVERLALKVELDSMYAPEGAAQAEIAAERQKARKAEKAAAEATKDEEEHSDDKDA